MNTRDLVLSAQSVKRCDYAWQILETCSLLRARTACAAETSPHYLEIMRMLQVAQKHERTAALYIDESLETARSYLTRAALQTAKSLELLHSAPFDRTKLLPPEPETEPEPERIIPFPVRRPIGRPSVPLEERFWSKVDRTDTHWPWKGSIRAGKPTFFAGPGKERRAQEVAYELTYGEVSNPRLIRVTCYHELCCNPACLSYDEEWERAS